MEMRFETDTQDFFHLGEIEFYANRNSDFIPFSTNSSISLINGNSNMQLQYSSELESDATKGYSQFAGEEFKMHVSHNISYTNTNFLITPYDAFNTPDLFFIK